MLRPTLPTNLLHGPTIPALLQLPLVYSLQLDRINIQLTDPVGDATMWFLLHCILLKCITLCML